MVKKILLIDDDLDFIAACRNFLESSGYQLYWENLETNALAKIKEVNPDLVILDVVMSSPESGFCIAKNVNDDLALKDMPIVFLTGYFNKADILSQEVKIKSQWPNVLGVLDKPVKPVVLLEMIKKMEVNYGK